ncbi:LPS export ABC transporter periplasmic protein LptC [Alteromonas facilis]|uniref:LPS export ABC transporter periplasmic protein LptC n=1 Tax=Alteromonas facilis TaxID=2048004 RepID=UPI000C287D22|nr:LPS export ABC transporter periplasmic protein LptC [Alteromonas facilis]
MNRLGYSISALFILALATYIPTWLKDESPETVGSEEDIYQPTYQAKNLRSALYDNDGQLSHRIFAQEMEHYEQLGFVYFKQPQYTIYMEDDQTPWRVTADEGTLYDDNRIQLERNVIIQSLSQEEFVKTISTEFLQINLETKIMTSDQAVTIVGEDYQIESDGLEADLNLKTYELQQHVQTIYSPSNKAN